MDLNGCIKNIPINPADQYLMRFFTRANSIRGFHSYGDKLVFPSLSFSGKNPALF
jgi:hypothetical protein